MYNITDLFIIFNPFLLMFPRLSHFQQNPIYAIQLMLFIIYISIICKTTFKNITESQMFEFARHKNTWHDLQIQELKHWPSMSRVLFLSGSGFVWVLTVHKWQLGPPVLWVKLQWCDSPGLCLHSTSLECVYGSATCASETLHCSLIIPECQDRFVLFSELRDCSLAVLLALACLLYFVVVCCMSNPPPPNRADDISNSTCVLHKYFWCSLSLSLSHTHTPSHTHTHTHTHTLSCEPICAHTCVCPLTHNTQT